MPQPTTLYLIAYDISSDKRRTRVHKTLSAYGRWTQYSLFECFLTRLQHVDLMARLAALIDSEADSLRLYPLCDGCVKRVETMGDPTPEEPTIFLL